jgi:maltose-binding protein MalE
MGTRSYLVITIALGFVLAGCDATAPSPSNVPETASPSATITQTPAVTHSIAPAPSTALAPPPTASASGIASGSLPPTASPIAPPGATKGTLTIWADDVRAPILQELGQKFTADNVTGVAVYSVDFDSLPARLTDGATGAARPDLFYGASSWVGSLVKAGVLEPLNSELAGKAASFESVGLDAFRYQGALYGMPYIGQAIALYYNKDLVPTAPATWDELKTTARQLQEAHTVDQGLCLPKGDPYHSNAIVTGFGGYLFGKSDDGSYNPSDVGLDSDGGLAAADEIQSLVADGLLRDGVDYATCDTLMTAGRAAFWMTGPWALQDFKTAHDERGLNFAVADMPAMAERPRSFVDAYGFMVTAGSPNAADAETFLTDYVATDETMATLWATDPRVPMWLPLARSMTDPNLIAFTNSAANGDPVPSAPYMPEVWRTWADALNSIFGQTKDGRQAFMDAASEIRTMASK